MLTRCLILAGMGLVSTSAMATADLSLHINEDAVKVNLQSSLTKTSETLYSAAYHYSEEEGRLLSLGALTTHSNSQGNFALGAKYVGVDPKGADNTHILSLGGSYGIAIAPNTKVSVSAFIAPSVLVSGDFERYVDIDVNLDYRLMPKASVMLGYKLARIDHESSEHFYFDKSVYLGAKFKF